MYSYEFMNEILKTWRAFFLGLLWPRNDKVCVFIVGYKDFSFNSLGILQLLEIFSITFGHSYVKILPAKFLADRVKTLREVWKSTFCISHIIQLFSVSVGI